MDERAGSRFEYEPGVIRTGSDCIADAESELATQGLERALVVCGQTVGRTAAVIDPVTEGLGDRLAGVFPETTPEKRLSTAAAAARALEDANADVLVGLGGGSSLDVAKVASVLAAGDGDVETLAAHLEREGSIPIPDGPLVPIAAVPTTLAGADLSQVAGVSAGPGHTPSGEAVHGGIGDPRLMPTALFYDPALVATTPESVLAGSAMNGFNKGIETLYARNATPVTDATAARGLNLLSTALVDLGERGVRESILERALEGVMLVQYGISRPGETTLSILHAFGHALTRNYDVQQGTAHAVVTPAVLEYLFDRVDGRRDLLARALDVPNGGGDYATSVGVVDAVTEVRDALDLPARLRTVDGLSPGDLREVAQAALDDRFMANAPPSLNPTVEELTTVLERAW